MSPPLTTIPSNSLNLASPHLDSTRLDTMGEPSTHLKHYRPYLGSAEVERLSAKQRGKLSASREERGRQLACALIDAVGVRCGL